MLTEASLKPTTAFTALPLLPLLTAPGIFINVGASSSADCPHMLAGVPGVSGISELCKQALQYFHMPLDCRLQPERNLQLRSLPVLHRLYRRQLQHFSWPMSSNERGYQSLCQPYS